MDLFVGSTAFNLIVLKCIKLFTLICYNCNFHFYFILL